MIGAGIDGWVAALWQASWQGGLALLLVWAIARLVPAMPPGVRCWLWRLAFLKVLLVLVGPAAVDVPLLPGETIAIPFPVVPAPPTAEPGSVVAPQILPVPVNLPAPASLAVSGSPAPGSSWPRLVFTGWLLGALACAVRLFRQWRRLQRLRHSCDEVRDEDLLRLRADLCRLLNLRREPPLRVSDRIERPMLVGTLRSEVILPVAIVQGAGREEQRLVLAHELGHLQRRDLQWAWLPAAVCTLFFFHPLVWLATAAWHHAHELACDELTLRTTAASPADYGQLLLQLSARPAPAGLAALPAAGIVGSYASLRGRLTALRHPAPEAPRQMLAIALTLGMLALLTLVPWRAVAASSISYLDLGGVANQDMEKGMGSDKLLGNNLAHLPRGVQAFAGLRFQVADRCIQLGSTMLPERPRFLEPIPVGRRFSTLAVLHGTMWGGAPREKPQHVPDGTPIAEYRVFYADGDMETIPVVYGAHLRDWWVPADPPVSGAEVAWAGPNDANPEPGIRLYAMNWTNPRPEVMVTHLKFASLGTAAAPFCVALTCGN